MRTIIDVRSWNRRYLQILADGRARIAAVLCALLIVVAVAVAGIWGLPQALAGAALALPPGAVLHYEHVSYGGGTLHLSGMRIALDEAGLTLAAPHVDVSGVGVSTVFGARRPLQMALDSPELRVGAQPGALGALRTLMKSASLWRGWLSGTTVRLHGGTVTFVTADGTDAAYALGAVAGNAAVSARGALTYDFTMNCSGGGTEAALVAATSTGADGALTYAWTADALPLAALGEMFATAPVATLRSGTLRDVRVIFAPDAVGTPTDPQLTASAHLEGGAIALGPEHTVRALHGALRIDDAAIATPLLSGTIDGQPLEVAGEVDDRGIPRFLWLENGNDDLRALTDLVTKVASADRVRSVRLEAAAPGLAFAQYTTQKPYGPLVATVLSIDPNEPTIRFETVLAGDHLTSGGERTSAMGVRTGAVAGINGDYYDIGGTWAPQGIVVRDGTLLRTPAERMSLAIHKDKRVTFQEYRLVGTVHVANRDVPLTQLNSWPAGDVTLMTPEYGKIPPARGVTLAELTPVDVAAGRYRIVRVASAVAESEPEFALAFGPLVHLVPKPGEMVTLHYGVDPPLGDTVSAIGGGPLLLHDGAWYEDPHAPAPDERDVHWAVVALGRRPDGRLLIAQVDGRHPERSIGMTRPDFAELLRSLGVADAMALDSGGSATIVSRAPGDSQVSVRNRPSDNDGERWVSNGLFLYSAAPAAHLLATPAAAAGFGAPPAVPQTARARP